MNLSILYRCLIIIPMGLCMCAHGQKDSSGYFTSFDKVKIWYEVKGKGKPVLLIHGFTGRGTDWKTKPVYDSLLANNFKVVIADFINDDLETERRLIGDLADVVALDAFSEEELMGKIACA